MIAALLALALADSPLQAAVDALLPEIAAARGLPVLHRVRVRIVTPERVRARTQRQTASPRARRELAGTRDALVALRVASPDLELRGLLVDVMGEQLGGWYGPRRHVLTVVRPEADAPELSAMDRVVVGHELVHAVQDQSHRIVRLRRRPARSGDVEIGLLGLVEGDATRLDVPLDPPEPTPGPETFDTWDAIEQLPLPVSVPLMFPYLTGPGFASHLAAVGPDALDAAFARPPLSSEQVIHPDRYLAGDAPRWPDLPSARRLLGRGWRVVADDAVGEIGTMGLLLAWGVDPATAANGASGWAGDRQIVVRHRDERLAVLWWTAWDTEPDARDFAALVTNGLADRRPADAVGVDRVGRYARQVHVVLGLPEAEAADVVRSLAEAPVRVWTSRHETAPENP